MIENILKFITLDEVIGSVMIFISVLVFFSIIWGNRTFSVKTLNQMIFHSKVPMDGTDDGIYKDWFIHTVPYSLIVCTLGEYLLYHLPNQRWHYFMLHHMHVLGIYALVLVLIYALINYQIIGYVFDLMRKSDLYEKHYVDPNKVAITFPKQKRNIIHIYMESIENTYLDSELGGGQKENYMTELGKLAQDNINFSQHDKIGGSLTLEGTQWTIASMVGQESGIPLLFPYNGKKYDVHSAFLPGVCTIGEILESQGYVNEMIMGSDSDFACTSNFYSQHGNFYLLDHSQAIKEGRLPPDYNVFWGFEDDKLFKFAREDLTKLAASGKPFNLEINTIDTHTPDGYVCKHCENKYSKQYANVIACQSKQVANFVAWCKEQSWYENTTIVLTGDHNSMAEKFFSKLDTNYVRTPYNCFINSAIDTSNSKNRQFSIIDFYPTMLASIGAEIEGERLGLGTNLFSNQKTLLEQYGFKKLNHEVKKKSLFYQEKLIGDELKVNEEVKVR